MAGDQLDGHGGGGGGDGVGDGSRGAVLVITQVLVAAAVRHIDVVHTTSVPVLLEVKIVESQCDFTV